MSPHSLYAKAVSLLVGFGLTTVAAAGDAVDGSEVMRKALDVVYYQGHDMRAGVDLTIVDAQGRERVRQMTLLRLNTDGTRGEQKYYVYFNKPSDVKRMVFMAWKHPGSGDDRWLYLPALDLVRRIAASDERTSFVGSHFYYEDVSGRNLDEDIHTLQQETDEYYVTRSVPTESSAVEFAYYRAWIDKQSYLPMKLEYYDDTDQVYRTYTVTRTELIDGFPTAVSAIMADNRSGGHSILQYSGVEYTIGLPENVFTERYLRKPAKKYVR